MDTSHRSVFPRFLYLILWVIPVLLFPAAIYIYLTEGRNLIQLFSLLSFSLLLTFVLRGLLRFVERIVGQHSEISISSGGILTVRHRRGERTVNLREVQSIRLVSFLPGITQLVVRLRSGKRRHIPMTGRLPESFLSDLKTRAVEYGIEITEEHSL